MKLRIQYEESFKCVAGCGMFVNRIGQTCNACLLKAERKNAAKIKADLRARLDPGPLCDDQGRAVA